MAKKTWQQRVATARLAVDRIAAEFERSQAGRVPQNLGTDTVEGLQDFYRSLEKSFPGYVHRPESLNVDLVIVAEDRLDWLDVQPAPNERGQYLSSLMTLGQMLDVEPVLPRVYVRHSPVFELGINCYPLADSDEPMRKARLSYYGNASSEEYIARAAEVLRDVRSSVPQGRLEEAGGNCFRLKASDLDAMKPLDRIVLGLLDIAWVEKKVFRDALISGRTIFHEGQKGSFSYRSDSLSDNDITWALRTGPHGFTSWYRPILPESEHFKKGWQIRSALVCDLFLAMKSVLHRWQTGTPAPTDLITQTEAGKKLRVKSKTIRDWIKQGRLRGYGPHNRPSLAEIESKGSTLRRRAPKTKKSKRRLPSATGRIRTKKKSAR
jgi:hypothetical protein